MTTGAPGQLVAQRCLQHGDVDFLLAAGASSFAVLQPQEVGKARKSGAFGAGGLRQHASSSWCSAASPETAGHVPANGFGVTVALLDATLIRIVILPSCAQPARPGAAGTSRWLGWLSRLDADSLTR